jgi:LemA protein
MTGILLLLLPLAALVLVGSFSAQKLKKMQGQAATAWVRLNDLLRQKNKASVKMLEAAKYLLTEEREFVNELVMNMHDSLAAEKAAEKIRIERNMAGKIERLTTLVKNHPMARRHPVFHELWQRWLEYDERIESAKKNYNYIADIYSREGKAFPGNIVASLYKLDKFPPFY